MSVAGKSVSPKLRRRVGFSETDNFHPPTNSGGATIMFTEPRDIVPENPCLTRGGVGKTQSAERRVFFIGLSSLHSTLCTLNGFVE